MVVGERNVPLKDRDAIRYVAEYNDFVKQDGTKEMNMSQKLKETLVYNVTNIFDMSSSQSSTACTIN